MRAQRDRLYADVDFLTSLRPFRNYRNIDSLEACCRHIRREFKRAGLAFEDQTWKVEGNTYTNVIARYGTGGRPKLIVGAHYDVCGDQPGADDNASAVAGLLEVARLLGEHAPRLAYDVELVAYCLEEPPFFASTQMGSYVHAQSLHARKDHVIGMVCFEMIGYFSDAPHSQPFPDPAWAARYPNTGNFIVVVGIQKHAEFNARVLQHMRDGARIDVQGIDFPDGNGLAGLSDQRNYWTFGYPALMLNDTSFLRNPHYHQPTDTIDTLDFAKMTEVVNGAYRVVTGL